jgi:pyruvate/2-oxoglutarate dehydrogenase complex dihydrolipoamide acyltransferase (E2) component
MPTEILMPALSPTMEEGKLAKWLVKEGQTIKAGDIIAEIETDKATMEVEAVDEGKVSRLLVAEGTEGVKVNTPIAVVLADGESEGAAARPQAPAPAARAARSPPAAAMAAVAPPPARGGAGSAAISPAAARAPGWGMARAISAALLK